MKAIEKTLHINAPKEKVWDVLVNDKLNRIWYAEFSEGTYAETDWKAGSKVKFIDKTNNGLVGRITESKPNESLILEYEGQVLNGEEDYESDNAKAMKGGRESYKLSSENGSTQLDIRGDMDESFYEEMAGAWDKALQKIKELAEA